MSAERRIVCVTPNVSVDRTYLVPGCAPGWVWRADEVAVTCGGKGVNVARALRTLGARAACTGFLAGHAGRTAADLAAAEGLKGHWTWVAGETRTNVIVVGTGGGEATVINEPGPTVTGTDWQALMRDVLEEATAAECVCLCGSLPPGATGADVASLVSAVRALGRTVWVDSSGDALAGAVRGGPSGVKINAEEAGQLLGQVIHTPEDAIAAADAIRQHGGVDTVVVTLGRQGAVAVKGNAAWRAVPPEIDVDNPVGSGDCFLGGLISGLFDNLDMANALRRATAAGTATALQRYRTVFEIRDYDRLLPSVTVTDAVGRAVRI